MNEQRVLQNIEDWVRAELEYEKFLKRAVELAEDGLNSGNQPFGSLLVDRAGNILFEDHNRDNTEDPTAHPELAISRWAARNLSEEERREAVVYTSGEHCPMCSTSHALVGLGKIVYVSSSAQLSEWLSELGVEPASYSVKSIQEMIPGADVEGPHEKFSQQVKALHERYHTKNKE